MFVSYAQNFEDVILCRALKGIEKGFYIDVGAQDPVVDSVSLAFYQKGWRGVHIEPSSAYAEALRKARPDEVIIEALVSDDPDDAQFYDIAGTGLSTANPEVAARHAANGFQSVLKSVAGMRLAEILDAYRDRDIHWLKIDVEGYEKSVIRSWKPSTVRPWIVVVEATSPLSQMPSFESWEKELLELGYDFVYFDGLNRFYLSRLQQGPTKMFGPGPNYFDEFQLTIGSPFNVALASEFNSAREAAQVESERLLTEGAVREAAALDRFLALQAEMQQREVEEVARETSLRIQLSVNADELARLNKAILEQSGLAEDAMCQIAGLRAQISHLHRSLSWRMTAPWRQISSGIIKYGNIVTTSVQSWFK
jgi:FkbM family methyltransferase